MPAAMLTRRTFGQGVAAGLLVAAARRPTRAARKRGAVLLGVQSYSLRDRSLDEAIAAMKEVGFATCELWQGHVEPKDPANLGRPPQGEDDRKRQREALREFRLKTPLAFWKDVARKFAKAGVPLGAYNYSFKDHFTDEEIARGFEMARALGVKVITASANQNVVARVAPLARKHRIKVAVHNHSKIDPNEFATPEDFAKAMTGPGREAIAVNLDIGHFTAANFDSAEYLRQHHQRISTLHIKDRKRDQGPAVPFGEGDAPIGEVLKLLRDNRWAIPANVEYEYPGQDTVAELRRCLEHCQRLVAG